MKVIPNLPKVPLNSSQIAWLQEAWRSLKASGNNPVYKEIRLNTRSQTGDQFDPSTIDKLLLQEKCTQITLLGVLHIEPDSEILEDADRIIRLIRQKLIADTGIEKFNIGEIASELRIDKKYAQIVFTLISMYGRFFNSASSMSSVNSPFGYEDFGITDDDTFDAYLKYTDIYSTIESFYIRQEEYKRREEALYESGNDHSHSFIGSKLRAQNRPILKHELELLDQKIFNETRGYLQKIAIQVSRCYQYELYDASFVLLRKLIEALIIEVFERHGISNKIKDADGHYFFLSQLIESLLSERKWNLSRNSASALPKLKKTADASAHNRRFLAQKTDIDKLEGDIRMMIEELIHLIDYPTWNNQIELDTKERGVQRPE